MMKEINKKNLLELSDVLLARETGGGILTKGYIKAYCLEAHARNHFMKISNDEEKSLFYGKTESFLTDMERLNSRVYSETKEIQKLIETKKAEFILLHPELYEETFRLKNLIEKDTWEMYENQIKNSDLSPMELFCISEISGDIKKRINTRINQENHPDLFVSVKTQKTEYKDFIKQEMEKIKYENGWEKVEELKEKLKPEYTELKAKYTKRRAYSVQCDYDIFKVVKSFYTLNI